jgi:hypothetical protein
MNKQDRTPQPSFMFATPTAGMLPAGTLERLRKQKTEEPLAPKRAAERYTPTNRYAPPHRPVSYK